VTVTSEEFDRWRDDAVTRWVARAFTKLADDNKALWLDQSWGAGRADQETLTELRTRADAYNALAEATYQACCDANEEEPINDAS
jgi:hypothetical protein